jgi:hypothetical protein
MKLFFFGAGVLCLYLITSLPGFDATIVKLLGLTVLALLVAANLRPSVAGIWKQRRLPSRRELAVILTCFVICAVSVWVLDSIRFLVEEVRWAVSKPGGASSYQVVDLTERLFSLLVVSLALVPAARLIVSAASIDTGPRPVMWPALLSIFAALPILLGSYFLLITADNQGVGATALFLNVVLAVPPTLLIVGFGLLLWWQAWRAASDAGFSLAGVFPRLAIVGMMIWLFAIVAAPAGLFVLPGPQNTGQIIGVTVMIGFGVAWLWVLRSVADLEATGLVSLSVATSGLCIAFGVSALVARGLTDSGRTQIGDASVLLLIFALPVIAMLVAGIVFGMPRLLRWLLRRPGAPVNPAAAR